MSTATQESPHTQMALFRDVPSVRVDEERPATRGDCVNGPRPCPWVGCRHHLLLDENTKGTLSVPLHGWGSGASDGGGVRSVGIRRSPPAELVHRWIEDAAEMLWSMPDTCSLDVADRGGITLENVGKMFGVTRERIRQVEDQAADKYKRSANKMGLSRVLDEWIGDLGAAARSPELP